MVKIVFLVTNRTSGVKFLKLVSHVEMDHTTILHSISVCPVLQAPSSISIISDAHTQLSLTQQPHHCHQSSWTHLEIAHRLNHSLMVLNACLVICQSIGIWIAKYVRHALVAIITISRWRLVLNVRLGTFTAVLNSDASGIASVRTQLSIKSTLTQIQTLTPTPQS